MGIIERIKIMRTQISDLYKRLKALEILGGGEPLTWGTITGNLEDQTDLQDALDGLQTNISNVNDNVNQLQDTVDDLADNIAGEADYIPKFTAANIIGNSRMFDDGVHLGIDTITPDKDIDFGNQSNREIGIQDAPLNNQGKDLTVIAGNTNQTVPSPDFNIRTESLQRNWSSLYTSPDGVVYSGNTTVVLTKNSLNDVFNIYATPGTGAFYKVAVHPDGSVYVPVYGGGIYKQTNGVGAFVNLGFSGNWFGIAVHQNGDVYAVRYGGSIFKQTAGAGAFVTLGEPNRNWSGIRCMDNGDVYAVVTGGDIYKQTNGTGAFNALGQTSRTWSDVCDTPSGDVYATVQNGSIYKQTGGVGNFVQVTLGNKLWTSITSDLEGNVYAATAISGDGYLYKLTGSTPNLNGGTLKLKAGVGQGTGQSRIEFYTTQKTVSGADLQEETLRTVIDEEGNLIHNGGNLQIHSKNNEENALILSKEGIVGITENPKFFFGRIVNGGINEPKLRIVFSDDITYTDEVTCFEVEPSGTAASVRSEIGSHYEAFLEQEEKPLFRIASFLKDGNKSTRMEFGSGGNNETDIFLERWASWAFALVMGGSPKVIFYPDSILRQPGVVDAFQQTPIGQVVATPNPDVKKLFYREGKGLVELGGDGIEKPLVNNNSGNFIPISGTTVGNPITGNIQFSDGENDFEIYVTNVGENNYRGSLFFAGTAIGLQTSDDDFNGSFFTTGFNAYYTSSNPLSVGISGVQDYTPNITDLDYTQKKYVDKQHSYSTAETLTGGTWIDGKPIYRIVIEEEWDFALQTQADFFPEGPGDTIRLIPFASEATEIINFSTRMVTDYSFTPRNVADRIVALGTPYSLVNGKSYGAPEDPTYIELYVNGYVPPASAKIKFTHIVEYVKAI